MSEPTIPRPIRVLLVDDDEDDFLIARDYLSDCDGVEYDVEWVADYETAKVRVATGLHDVCLVDYFFFLGAHTGLDLIEETRGPVDAIPMILLTGAGCRELDLKAMEAGASDYLLKTHLTPTLLERAIRYAMDRRRTQQDLERLARYDQLTGSLNRAFFHERLAEATCRSRRTGDPVALLFVDLNEFKPINDVHGHDTGDALLREVADRLRASVRDVDTVSRLGGDEFTVILEGMARAPDAALAAQRILESVARPCVLAERHLQITASVGIALYPNDAEDEDALIKCADMAMYRAKEHRGNAYEFFSPAMTAAATGRQHLHSRLRSALDNEEFVVYYQPLVDVVTGEIQGVEALLRWQRDDTLVPPFEFIPALEDSGMIVDVGAWVLRRACHDVMHGLAGEAGPLRLAVNLSPQQFRAKNLESVVRIALEESGLAPEQLDLEITERLFIADTTATAVTVTALRKMGVRVAIDDFGTGYCSLSYLKHFPVDVLKVDREFIKDIPQTDNGGIAAAVIALGHSLGLEVIAEGVETADQLAFLVEHDCELFQGYLVSRPRSVQSWETFLAERNPLARAS